MRQLRSIAGLALVGYALLVTAGLVAHESPTAAVGSLLLGAALLSGGGGLPSVAPGRAAAVASIGLVAAGGVLSYNLVVGSGLGLPEWGILAYGLALVAASACLDRCVGPLRVEAAVGWSFPLLLGPLALFALDASLAGPAGPRAGSLATPAIEHLLVTPTALVLELLGSPVASQGTNLMLDGDGSRVLGVGLVCSGLYPSILFAGLLGLFVWERDPPTRTAATFLGVGLAGLYLVNITRLVGLVLVGRRWGFAVLDTVHAHAGWLLYGLFALVFWVILAPRIENRAAEA